MVEIWGPVWGAENGSIANLKREIAEKKWAEARSWAEERIRGKKYRLSRSQWLNRMVERAPKRLSGRFHQLRTGHWPHRAVYGVDEERR